MSPMDPLLEALEEEMYQDRLDRMNVAQRTWRRGRFAVDLRPGWQWSLPGRYIRGMWFLGRISLRWYR